MPIPPTHEKNTIIVPAIHSPRAKPAKFANTLHSIQVSLSTAAPVSIANKKILQIGTINKENPTVSHLLKNHPDYRNDCWKIIFSAANKDKKYREIPEGSIVSINQDTKELRWDKISGETHPGNMRADQDN